MLRRIKIARAWRTVHDTGVNAYQENEITGERRVIASGSGYQPVNIGWLRGDVDDPTVSAMPALPSGGSVISK
ncbi:hypothetical protein BXY70_1346 [Roseovarius halotolerans]|uniref:Uncharacterized protein n=1 Tax=Roseovarius halotolerans TaxID=505353 RepID=A0A1X6Y5I0_9RHOB|nr:hypothetical protein [Roseovarius halotolerans]RKT35313.1 hypothetical protein BXY70_1346 [Roseovarius halotolerans]SLN11023.1 hypothetical protein ROH8110_00050 [Roseovarius halotolerans]